MEVLLRGFENAAGLRRVIESELRAEFASQTLCLHKLALAMYSPPKA